MTADIDPEMRARILRHVEVHGAESLLELIVLRDSIDERMASKADRILEDPDTYFAEARERHRADILAERKAARRPSLLSRLGARARPLTSRAHRP